MKLLIVAGSASLLLLGCSSPRGGTDESSLEEQNQAAQQAQEINTYTNEGAAPATMNTPNMPSSRNPRDLRDPQSMTIPGPPLGPRPQP